MDDSAIVELFWKRDEQAIAATTEKYNVYCLSIAMNILGNIEDAEECVNDAYLNTWNSIPPNKPKMLSTYLGKIVRNMSFNLCKKNRAKKRTNGSFTLILDELSEIITDSKNIEDEGNARFLLENINSFLKEIPAEKRQIFVCRYWYSDSVRDIAKRYGMTENNVSVTLKRIRKKLHDYLVERGVDL